MSKDVEIRDHVTRFHELMFTLSPQKQTIQENLDRAFNLADRSAWEYSQDLAEKGYYSRLISANISQQMIVDSVKFVGTGYPRQKPVGVHVGAAPLRREPPRASD